MLIYHDIYGRTSNARENMRTAPAYRITLLDVDILLVKSVRMHRNLSHLDFVPLKPVPLIEIYCIIKSWLNTVALLNFGAIFQFD
jgi:hypothetical protein